MNAQKIIILIAYCLAALIAVTANKGYYALDKKGERPFMMGMRYGRIDKGMKPGGGKHLLVVPRNDKFFLASRYGKRSSDMKSPPLIYPVTPICASNEDMTCTYTGISNIYRCIHGYAKPPSPISEVPTTSM